MGIGLWAERAVHTVALEPVGSPGACGLHTATHRWVSRPHSRVQTGHLLPELSTFLSNKECDRVSVIINTVETERENALRRQNQLSSVLGCHENSKRKNTSGP